MLYYQQGDDENEETVLSDSIEDSTNYFPMDDVFNPWNEGPKSKEIDPEIKICSRGACKFPLTHGFYKIWNEPSTGVPRSYCISCGRQIMEFNLSQPEKEHMKYEIIGPER